MISKRVWLILRKVIGVCIKRCVKEVTFNDLERCDCGEGRVIVLALLVVAKINMRETVRDASFQNVDTDLEMPIRRNVS